MVTTVVAVGVVSEELTPNTKKARRCRGRVCCEERERSTNRWNVLEVGVWLLDVIIMYLNR